MTVKNNITRYDFLEVKLKEIIKEKPIDIQKESIGFSDFINHFEHFFRYNDESTIDIQQHAPIIDSINRVGARIEYGHLWVCKDNNTPQFDLSFLPDVRMCNGHAWVKYNYHISDYAISRHTHLYDLKQAYAPVDSHRHANWCYRKCRQHRKPFVYIEREYDLVGHHLKTLFLNNQVYINSNNLPIEYIEKRFYMG